MLEFCPVNFSMPSGNPAVCADRYNDTLAACDGFCPEICVFSPDGILTEVKQTKRIFKKLHYDKNMNRFVALENKNLPFVFYLDKNFNELASVRLRNAPGSCSAVINDAYPVSDGENGVIAACLCGNIRAYSQNGEPICAVRIPENDIIALDILFNGRTEALDYIKNNETRIEIKTYGKKFKGTLDPEFSLRSFIPYGRSDVLGLFGYHYDYNYILPVYVNGEFALPDKDNIGDYIRLFTKGC